MRPYARRRSRARRLWWLLPLIVVLAVAIPALRAAELVEAHVGSSVPVPSDIPGTPVRFAASDGITLDGWLTSSTPQRAVVILVPGFKEDRSSMVPYARFLQHRYTVLLYDSRGTGMSDGHFTAGPREVDDVLGAVRFLHHRFPRMRIGVLGISLGAGVAIEAAARDHRLRAVVADSAYTDQNVLVSGLDHLHLGPLSVPLAPVAARVIDVLGHVHINTFRPVDVVARISPRSLLLIHSRHDTNPTTPLAGARRLQQTAGGTAQLWIAPHGGHAGALAAQPAVYEARVLAFFKQVL